MDVYRIAEIWTRKLWSVIRSAKVSRNTTSTHRPAYEWGDKPDWYAQANLSTPLWMCAKQQAASQTWNSFLVGVDLGALVAAFAVAIRHYDYGVLLPAAVEWYVRRNAAWFHSLFFLFIYYSASWVAGRWEKTEKYSCHRQRCNKNGCDNIWSSKRSKNERNVFFSYIFSHTMEHPVSTMLHAHAQRTYPPAAHMYIHIQ